MNTLGTNPSIAFEQFDSKDQQEARQLILEGLAEHWGVLDPRQNPDLEDIASAYSTGVFLVAKQDGQIVATGAFRPHDAETVEIVRMSVRADCRRQGLGFRMLGLLCAQARAQGFGWVVLETTETWLDVIDFYLRFGFSITHRQGGDVYFRLEL